MNRHSVVLAGAALSAVLGALHPRSAHSVECAQLAQLKLPHTQITLAESVSAGAFKPPGGTAPAPGAPPDAYSHLPPFCRVAGTLKPSADSDIRFEVWMPASGWNGKFVGVGNGVWAGSITYFSMAQPIAMGYATAATDDGHQGSPMDASFAQGHPEKLVDFGYRAPHEMTVAAKAVIAAFYGTGASRSLFVSCSTGGRQALMEAYRYPGDYDGISSMAPANPMVKLMVSSLWTGQATLKEADTRIPPQKFALIHKAAVQACDADDGVKDGIISFPQSCHFDPGVLQCKAGDGPDCLTAAQVGALRAIYQGPRNPRTGKSIFPGFEPGSEAMFPIQTAGPLPFGGAFTFMRDLVIQDPKWDFRSFDYDKDVTRAMQAGSAQLDVPSRGLASFFAGGRKLLLSHGWADGLIPPMSTVNFYTELTTHLGPKESENTRLFMIPGMGHCAGGDGPFVFDPISTIDKWVETGHPPQRIVVSNPPGAPARTRPLCPYPRKAVYSGAGSTDDEKNFTCSEPSAAQSSSDQGRVVGLAFVGRMVSDLDRSVAFYKAIGFSQDPAANPAWRKDDVVERLYGVSGVQTRMAKMYVNNTPSGQRFVVYLRELKGLPRKTLSNHTPWDPGVTHFGLIVPDADAVWERLQTSGMLRARSWDAKLIAPPGQTKGLLAYMTDPDGLDIELIGQRPAAPAENGRPARPALLPGVNHVGVVILDSEREKAFYGTLFDGQLQSTEAPWLKGDFYDSAVGGHGNILRFFNESFPEAAAPGSRLNLELVEFQNRKKPVEPAAITDVGVGYVGIEVQNLDAFLKRAEAAGARPVSPNGIVTMRSGTREVMIRDPDVGMFIELFEHPRAP